MAALSLGGAGAIASSTPASPMVFIDEIHYDNVGVDVNEGVEVAGPAGTALSGFSLVMYNGHDGRVYDTVALSGVLPNQQAGFGTMFFAIPGLQNGAPDGLVLAAGRTVMDALAYEGTFTATNGPASGMTLHDIGRFEPPSTPVGKSLQLQGSGSSRAAFHWSGPLSATPGQVNHGQTFASDSPPVTGITMRPTEIAPPPVTGTPSVGHSLSCGTGSWTNEPSGYSYQWNRDAVAIIGATQPTYVVGSADVGHSLACRVTAANAGGTASFLSSSVAISAAPARMCAHPSGELTGKRLGPIAIGETRYHARQALPFFAITHNQFDRYCLAPSRGIRAGYPSSKLAEELTPAQRRTTRGRVILALTANARYTIDGVASGTPLSALSSRMSLPRPIQVGLNAWYLLPGSKADEVLKVQDGTIREIGIASRSLTRSRATAARLLRSFG